MTARADFLTYLSGLGTPANAACKFEEGSGAPAENYSSSLMTASGSWSWVVDGTYGASYQANATSAYLQWPGVASTILNGTAQTLLIVRRKTDLTLRNAQVQGLNTGNNNEKFDFYNPFGDGHAYADFGGSSGSNRLDLSGYVASTSHEAWAMRAGAGGISIWKDGTLFGTPSFTAVTRVSPAVALWLNRGFLNPGDIQEFYFVALVPYELSDTALQNFTVGRVLLGLNPPIISTTTLPDAERSAAYTTALATSGGTAPLTFSLVSGTLPPGLTLSALLGVIAGIPTTADLYHFTVGVTDAALQSTSSVAYALYVDDPLCVPQAVASLTRGVFTNNSRVGPHQTDGKKIALILRDADNTAKLTASYSANNGLTWTLVSTAVLVSSIASHDSHLVGTTVHAWTQESTGRVAYHTFDLTTGLWTLENQQVSAAETILAGAVSGTVLSPSLDPAVVYESTKENVVGTDRKRMTYRRRSGGLWSSALPMGDIGQAQSDIFGRLIAGNANRATMIMTVDPGYSVASTPDFQMQIVRSDGTLSAITVFRTTGLGGSNPSYFVGDYTTYTSGADLILVVPVKFGGEPTIFSFVDSDTPATASLGEPVLGNFVGEGPFVPIVTRWVDGELHTIDFGWGSLGSESFLRHKSCATALGPFEPSDMNDQTGPLMGVITTTQQTMDGDFQVRSCDDVASLYVATVVPIGTIDGVTQTVKFEWLKVADLPSSGALTLAQWLLDLDTQTIDYCCTAEVVAAASTCECNEHPGRIYRMSMDLYTDDGCTIRRLRRATHISEEQARMIHHLLQVDVEAGQGLTTGQGSDPQIMLRFSDDGGITWSNERWESAGAKGEFKKRVMFYMLGSSRDRVYELVVTDPVKWAIVSGYLDISAGFK